MIKHNKFYMTPWSVKKPMMIDAHIHLDRYRDEEIEQIVGYAPVEALISVSLDFNSCKRNRDLFEKYFKVKPAFGYHPEQALPSDNEIAELLRWIEAHHSEMIAIGEVGLPYYSKLEQEMSKSRYEQYIELLEAFIVLAEKYDKPLLLHAIYDDAPMVCDLLEKHSFNRAHFHWFKGDSSTMSRMIENGYFVSVTPDVVYENEIQKIVSFYPTNQIMVETDGPWPFEDIFSGKMTHPEMMRHSLRKIAALKNQNEREIEKQVLSNTRSFFRL